MKVSYQVLLAENAPEKVIHRIPIMRLVAALEHGFGPFFSIVVVLSLEPPFPITALISECRAIFPVP
jgi:hypothetical protein